MDQALALRRVSRAAIAALSLYALPAYAEGITAGTLIENTATASFSANGTARTVDSNTVTITVDEVLNVAVASQDSGAIPGTGTVVLKYQVTNTGNGPESFTLTADPAVAGNDFDLAVTNLAIDTNGNGIYDAGVDTLLANGAASPSIDPDAALTVFVLTTVPGGTADGDNSQARLSAQSTTGSGTPGTVFAGAGTDGVDAVVGASTAASNDVGTVVSSLATVTLTKSAVVADPFGGTQPIPGAVVTYTIVAAVSGSGSVTGLGVDDPFPTSTTYVAGSLALDSSALTDAADGDAGTANATGVSVDLGDVSAGTSKTITFKVSIDN